MSKDPQSACKALWHGLILYFCCQIADTLYSNGSVISSDNHSNLSEYFFFFLNIIFPRFAASK